jgi:hypothetical protein
MTFPFLEQGHEREGGRERGREGGRERGREGGRRERARASEQARERERERKVLLTIKKLLALLKVGKHNALCVREREKRESEREKFIENQMND